MPLNYDNPEKYIGQFEETYLGYASENLIRNGAGSGGVTSAISIYLLEKGYVDGVLVSKSEVRNERITADCFIATTRQEILDSRQSIYMDFNYTKNLRAILDFKGQIAMVGLPCHFEILSGLESKHPELKDKIKFKLSLFCSGVPKTSMVHEVINNKKVNSSDIKKFYFRQGHWRGQSKIVKNDGTEIEFSYLKNFGMYKNMYFDMLPRCSVCKNHFGYDADFSIGDAWLKEMKVNPIKHNLFIAKNNKANRIVQNMINDGFLKASLFDYKKVLYSQRRPITYKFYAAKARKVVANLFGINLKVDTPDKSAFHHYIVSIFISLNVKLSENKKMRRIIYKVPKKIMYSYHAFIRLLLSR
ncbi:Coenzyme F420 hydrogenase/dehydrogenase, beta subunit C-terminal domain [Paenibacillus lentus]|uniref:Coenzyme F420 hydrogenase/dehydrogenase, beta subunit C-terminal domain n=1 Tax=Paenibacillus lentus TaxID=1338368 RepID=UPI00364862E0